MRGLIYREPADLLETDERSKGNEPGTNTKRATYILRIYYAVLYISKLLYKINVSARLSINLIITCFFIASHAGGDSGSS
jgi:hypothetical protein